MTTYINRNDLLIDDQKIYDYPVFHIDRYRVVLIQISFEFMQSERGMERVHFQYTHGLGISFKHIRMFFKKFGDTFFIGITDNDLIVHL